MVKAHRTDGVSLVFALIFLAVAGWWLLAQIMELALPAVGWFLAGALIFIGVLGLFGALRSGRSTPPAGASGAAEAAGGTGGAPDPVVGTDPTAVMAPVPSAEPVIAGHVPAERSYGAGETALYGAGDEPPTREFRYSDEDAWPVTDSSPDQPQSAGAASDGTVPGDAASDGPATDYREPPADRTDRPTAEPRTGRE